MWLYTPLGFFSIVQDKKDADVLWVRARYTGDLENLRDKVLPTLGPILQLPGRDYRYRAKTSKFEWAEALAALALDLDYSNFKDEVTKQQGRARHDLYLSVWGVMVREQSRQQYPKRESYTQSQPNLWDWPDEWRDPRDAPPPRRRKSHKEPDVFSRRVVGNDFHRNVTLPVYDTGHGERRAPRRDPWTPGGSRVPDSVLPPIDQLACDDDVVPQDELPDSEELFRRSQRRGRKHPRNGRGSNGRLS